MPYVEKLKDLTTCRKVEAQAHKVIQSARSLTVSRGDLVLNAQTAFAEISTEQGSENLFHIHDAANNTFVEMHRKWKPRLLAKH